MLNGPKVKKPDMPYTSQVASYVRDNAAVGLSALSSGKVSPVPIPSTVTPSSVAAQRQGGRPSMVISQRGLLGG